jgi:hypothetical protein
MISKGRIGGQNEAVKITMVERQILSKVSLLLNPAQIAVIIEIIIHPIKYIVTANSSLIMIPWGPCGTRTHDQEI